MGKEKFNERPLKQTYVVFENGEVLEDPLLIDYYKLHQFDLILQSKLLGEFTKEGKYELGKDTKLALVNLRKYLVEVRPGVFFAESELKHSTLHFQMDYWREDDSAYASLFLVERVGESKIVSFVAQYADLYSESFTDNAKLVFKIKNSPDENSDVLDEYDEYFNNFFEELERKQLEREFIVELQSEILVEEIIAILKKEGAKYEQIVKAFEEQKQFELTQPDKSHMYTRLRRFLDETILAAGGLGILKQQVPAIEKPLQVFVKPIKEYDQISKKLDSLSEPKALPKKILEAKKAAKSASKSPKAKAIKPYKPEKPGKSSKPKKEKQVIITKGTKDIDVKAPSVPKDVAPKEPTERYFNENPKNPTVDKPAKHVEAQLPKEPEEDGASYDSEVIEDLLATATEMAGRNANETKIRSVTGKTDIIGERESEENINTYITFEEQHVKKPTKAKEDLEVGR